MKLVIVCGSRDWKDRDHVFDVLIRVEWMLGEYLLVHGGCPTGADKFADDWVKSKGRSPRVYEANWKKYGNPAGPMRNKQMAECGAIFCVAFRQRPKSTGTNGMIKLALAAGIPTLIVPATLT